ncbi:MAG: polysaccharide pyruvyl transferase family protein [Microgenomates group bacterium]
MKSNKKYLIPNITSAANVGDEAMLEVVMELIRDAHPKAEISVHGFEPETHRQLDVTANRSSLYYWAIFEDERALMRAYRLLLTAVASVAAWFSYKPLLQTIAWASRDLSEIINDYVSADAIVFVGGGYLRSKKGLSQSLNFILHVLPFALASTTVAKTVVAPISVGPFAYTWQSRVTAWIFRRLDVVTVRERFSHKLLTSAGMSGHVLATDHALLMTPGKKTGRNGASKNKPSKNAKTIGFTIRNWLDSVAQQELEQSYAVALAEVSKATGASIQPIIQVSAPRFGEDDGTATAKVVGLLKEAGIPVKPMVQIKNVAHGKDVYGDLSVLVGMRMHSNIFAGTQFVPFVPISYEYKTEGISEDFGLSEFCIRSEDLTAKNLSKNLAKVLKQRHKLSTSIAKTLKIIQKRERARWQKVFK